MRMRFDFSQEAPVSNIEKRVLLLGDAIIVPTKQKSIGGIMQQIPFITQILSQTAMTSAVVAAAY